MRASPANGAPALENGEFPGKWYDFLIYGTAAALVFNKPRANRC